MSFFEKRKKGSLPRTVKMKVTYTRPVLKKPGKKTRVIIIERKKIAIAAVCVTTAVVVGMFIYSYKARNEASQIKDPPQSASVNDPISIPSPKPVEPEKPKEPPVIDLSGKAQTIKSSVERINEPIPFGKEILYSGGDAVTINEPVFSQLFMYNMESDEERVVAETEIKFGELYEGRFNNEWIVWLDTNQNGTNELYSLNRKTNEISKIKSCNLNKPKLQLWGDNLAWVEQKDTDQDRLYLYNFKSGEPISLESFDNPTYGTCPPAISHDILVWTCSGKNSDENTSLIKKLDLSKALSISQEETLQQESQTPSESGEMMGADEGVEPEIIDPKGFAIYPATNGNVIAWLDNLDPSQANLKMTIDGGSTIKTIAKGVARPFGVGDKFVAYMQNDSIMLYFWEINRYARLTAPGEKGRLSMSGIEGNTVVWYDANDNNRKEDIVKINIVEQPSGSQLEY